MKIRNIFLLVISAVILVACGAPTESPVLPAPTEGIIELPLAVAVATGNSSPNEKPEEKPTTKPKMAAVDNQAKVIPIVATPEDCQLEGGYTVVLTAGKTYKVTMSLKGQWNFTEWETTSIIVYDQEGMFLKKPGALVSVGQWSATSSELMPALSAESVTFNPEVKVTDRIWHGHREELYISIDAAYPCGGQLYLTPWVATIDGQKLEVVITPHN